MGSLYDRCRAHTKRTYPDGYGFALIYLSDKLNPAHLRDGACLLVGKAYGPKGSYTDRTDPDLVRFVNAYANADRFEDYAIEAAQFVLGYGICGDKDAANVLALCGHPGY